MYKKYPSVLVGVLLLATPLAASAQTATTDNSALIAVLQQLIVILTQELQQLIAAQQHMMPTQPTIPSTSVNFTAAPTSGSAPLAVMFSAPAVPAGARYSYSVEFGDESNQTAPMTALDSKQSPQTTHTHI